MPGSSICPYEPGCGSKRLSRNGDRFEVIGGGRTLSAENVVVATGAYHAPRIPPLAPELHPSILQLHSKEYRNPSQIRKGGVLVVGAGNSGAEIAVELARHHRTWLSGRDTGQEPTPAGSLAEDLFTPVLWFLAIRVSLLRRSPVPAFPELLSCWEVSDGMPGTSSTTSRRPGRIPAMLTQQD